MAELGQPRHAAVSARGGRASRIVGAVLVAALASVLAVQMVPASARVVVYTTAGDARRAAEASTPQLPAPRVLLMGDSLMDQQGSAAAFELRQNGINAKSLGAWGTSLLTRNQYDFGKTKLTGGWLLLAAQQIKSFDPNVVAVYLNHNYWPPWPRDAAGHEIVSTDGLWTAAGQSMLRQQAAVLVTILRSRGAAVYFVAPVPAGTISNPDPNVWSPIWHGYQPVLASMHVPVIDSAAALRGPNGLRKETAPSCTGAPERIRPAGDLHMTRFGAGLAGSSLATAVTDIVGGTLNGSNAPGDRTAALVPVPSGGGYWLVGCDGSVYHFGHAAHLPGALAAVAGHRGVAAAAATRDGRGLWLVTGDGTIVPVGDASPMTFSARPARGVTGASVTPDGRGIVATTGTGVVLTAGSARNYGNLASMHLAGGVVDIELTRDGKGYWLVANDGRVFAFGDAHAYGSHRAGLHTPGGLIAGIAATPDGRGYWEVSTDGSIFSFGDARFLGTAQWVTPPYPYSVMRAVPGPAIDVVAAPGTKQGYWVVGDTGRVNNLGAAVGAAGDAGLAMETQ
jgi:ribosomal protein L24E